MHRPTIGLLAVVILAVGLLSQSYGEEGLSAACFRVGAVMAILWFAQPQLRDVPRWLLIVGGVALLVIFRWPKLVVVALPLAAVLWVLRPRTRRVGTRDHGPGS